MEKLLERSELSWLIMILARSGVAEVVLFVILRHSGIRNERTDLEDFLAEKRKEDSACKSSSGKRQALNFFLNVSEKKILH